MSILTGPEIVRHVRQGTIVIDPFDETAVGPNSYDLRLAPEMKVYSKAYPLHLHNNMYWCKALTLDERLQKKYLPSEIEPLDMKVEEPTVNLTIPEEGLVIWPGICYLACTVECAGSDIFIPCVEGRSSIGRFAVFAHTSAGFGDLSFSGPDRPAQWTLEVVAVQPVRIYAGIRICQVIFTTPEHGKDLGPLPRYNGKYTGQRGPKPSYLWKDLQKETPNG